MTLAGRIEGTVDTSARFTLHAAGDTADLVFRPGLKPLAVLWKSRRTPLPAGRQLGVTLNVRCGPFTLKRIKL